MASPDHASGRPASREDARVGHAALGHLHPLAARLDVDLQPAGRVRMGGGDGLQRAARAAARPPPPDHVGQLGRAERLAAPDPPQVELVRLSDVEPVDPVPPPDQAGAGEERVVGRRGGEAAEQRRDHGRGLRPEQPAAGDVAGVAGVARGAAGRVEEPVVVVGDGDDRLGPLLEHRAAPGVAQRRDGGVDEELHGVGPLGRVGQVAEGQGSLQGFGREDGVRHVRTSVAAGPRVAGVSGRGGGGKRSPTPVPGPLTVWEERLPHHARRGATQPGQGLGSPESTALADQVDHGRKDSGRRAAAQAGAGGDRRGYCLSTGPRWPEPSSSKPWATRKW